MNILHIELFKKPIDLNMAISSDLFLIKIVRTEIRLKAATIIINVRIINITFLSTLSASKNVLFVSTQEYIKLSGLFFFKTFVKKIALSTKLIFISISFFFLKLVPLV